MSRMATAAVLAAAVLVVGCADAEDNDDDSVAATTTSAVAEVTINGETAPAASAPATPTTASTSAPTSPPQPVPADQLEVMSFPVPAGSRPHDVAPATDGGVWYTAQRAEALGHLDPETGETRHIPLGPGSAPHGVIVGPDGLAWITDGGLNAIVSVGQGDEVTVYPLPADASNANLNTAAFDGSGRLWFTGQNGFHGVLDPDVGQVEVFSSPRGTGPYGITATPTGDIYFASLAGSYVGFVSEDGSVLELEPPTPAQGARRVWADSEGSIWVSEWNSGQLSRYRPQGEEWDVWPLPGSNPSAYAVYVDELDQVWVSDFGGNAIHRFDPTAEVFDTFALPANPSDVRQILGRPGEIWGAESANDSLVVIRTRR
ncbi:MAG: Vgb family protein [Acidimicrobiales bacterium]